MSDREPGTDRLNDIGPLPAVHPRTMAVHSAKALLLDFMTDLCVKYRLTRAEELLILTEYTHQRCACAVVRERTEDD